jgi:hypothetical protein
MKADDWTRFAKRVKRGYGGTCNVLKSNQLIRKGQQIFAGYDSAHSELAGEDVILGYVLVNPEP